MKSEAGVIYTYGDNSERYLTSENHFPILKTLDCKNVIAGTHRHAKKWRKMKVEMKFIAVLRILFQQTDR